MNLANKIEITIIPHRAMVYVNFKIKSVLDLEIEKRLIDSSFPFRSIKL